MVISEPEDGTSMLDSCCAVRFVSGEIVIFARQERPLPETEDVLELTAQDYNYRRIAPKPEVPEGGKPQRW